MQYRALATTSVSEKIGGAATTARTLSSCGRASALLQRAHVLLLRETGPAPFRRSCAARSSSWGMLVVKGPPSSASGVGSQNRENSSSQRHSCSSRVSFLRHQACKCHMAAAGPSRPGVADGGKTAFACIPLRPRKLS